MSDILINHTVKKSREGSYYTIPFQVPEDVSSLTVTYSYPRAAASGEPPVNVIDIGLEDASGQFLGWSGSSRKSVTAGEFDATPGYRAAPVQAGTWHILVGAYHVQSSGLPVLYEITFEKKGPRWLFGDLHVHSTASDGKYDVPALARKAKSMGLDFLSVTDHNNYAENYFLPKVPGLTLIPGTEWTHYKGHMNFFGVRAPFGGSFIANDLYEMRRVVLEASSLGALISVNHPKCRLCPYLWEDDTVFDAMEIWNGPMRKANADAISMWTKLLQQGRRIPAIGGSDFHRRLSPVRLGVPVTAVYAASKSADDILAAVAAGHCYVTGSVRGVRLDMTCGGATFGDVAADRTVTVSAERMPPFSVLRLIGDSGVLFEFSEKHGRVHEQVSLPKTSFVYLTAGRAAAQDRGMPAAISNPIYFERE